MLLWYYVAITGAIKGTSTERLCQELNLESLKLRDIGLENFSIFK